MIKSLVLNAACVIINAVIILLAVYGYDAINTTDTLCGFYEHGSNDHVRFTTWALLFGKFASGCTSAHALLVAVAVPCPW